MFNEARKIQLIEEVLKASDESTLTLVEAIFKKTAKKKTGKPKSAHSFSGIWSKKDVSLIEKAINSGCEQIHPDDWQ
jgi:6-phosphogluconate dehydrogenase